MNTTFAEMDLLAKDASELEQAATTASDKLYHAKLYNALVFAQDAGFAMLAIKNDASAAMLGKIDPIVTLTKVVGLIEAVMTPDRGSPIDD